jgi:hypothetical protein
MVSAPTVGRYMQDLTYRFKDNYELANKLSYLGEELTELGVPFGKRWKDFTKEEQKIIHWCKSMLEREGYNDMGKTD